MDGSQRTLFVSASGLEQAKQLISAYKLGHVPSMTPELWAAKKIVDSTLHPGALEERKIGEHDLITPYRYRGASFPPVSHVVLRHFQPGGHGRDAHSRHEGALTPPTVKR